MPAPSRRDELAGVEPRAVASQSGDQELLRRCDPRHVRVELAELLSGERSPGIVPCAERLTYLGEREAGFLQQGDGRQTVEHRRVVLAAPALTAGGRDQPGALVIAQSRALEAGRPCDLTDTDQVLLRDRRPPLDLKRTSTVTLGVMETPQPLACTLDGPDLVNRIEEWREVVARAKTRRVEDGRVVAVYPKDAQI